MPKERPSVDSKSFELAEHFLQDEPNVTEDDKWELAGDIQSAVESWFAHREHEVTVAAEGDERCDCSATTVRVLTIIRCSRSCDGN